MPDVIVTVTTAFHYDGLLIHHFLLTPLQHILIFIKQRVCFNNCTWCECRSLFTVTPATISLRRILSSAGAVIFQCLHLIAGHLECKET